MMTRQTNGASIKNDRSIELDWFEGTRVAEPENMHRRGTAPLSPNTRRQETALRTVALEGRGRSFRLERLSHGVFRHSVTDIAGCQLAC
jgi:hypothetical protein